MGVDYTADLGYGVNLGNSTLGREIENNLSPEEFKYFRVIWSGNAYDDDDDDDMIPFLCISDSCTRSIVYNKHKEPIHPMTMMIQASWNDKLSKWCSDNNITNYKIGWWLCSYVH
jgi:hypothetical protein